MAFTFAAFAYLIALIAVAFCIFFAIYTVLCCVLKRCYSLFFLHCSKRLFQLILPEYVIQMSYTVLFLLIHLFFFSGYFNLQVFDSWTQVFASKQSEILVFWIRGVLFLRFFSRQNLYCEDGYTREQV
ncbi:unnamed protein product [Angiostrongylus costaricensis]|uniref:Protein TEX261 n=1 Tax=Angiostrongylus costaricensis TaxID=334426 RepID=A0A0R3PS08_ANGCS|nr:unnamed protein product [Angiostrongylus costaricensis]